MIATIETVHCDTCGAKCVPTSCTPGYGEDQEGKRHCFACCGKRDKEGMLETGRAVLYLSRSQIDGEWHVSNWPGTLKIWCQVSRGRHNIAGVRYDVRFIFGGKQWSGVQYGDNTQICRCRRLKSK